MGRITALLVLPLLLAGLAEAQTRYVWNGGTFDWDDSSRWTPAGVPGPVDTAVVASGVASLTAPTIVAGFELPALGAIDGNHDLTITAAMAWSGGGAGFKALRGEGTVRVAPGATLRMDGTAPSMRYGAQPGRTFVNAGSAVWTGPGRWDDTGRFVNEGVLLLAMANAEAQMLCFSSVPGAITNASGGVIRRTGTGVAVLTCSFRNEGTVRAETGTLDLRGWTTVADTDTGAYEVDEGGLLLFGANTRTLTEASSITGPGTVEASSSGTVIVNGTFSVPRLLIGRGTSFPTFTLNTDATLAVLEMGRGRLAGAGTVTVTDTLRLAAPGTQRSDMFGTGETVVPAGTALLMEGSLRLGSGRTLTVETDWTWPGGVDIHNFSGDVTLRNASTVTLSGVGNRTFFAGTFLNEGTLRHEAGVTVITAGFSNSGELEVTGGTLRQQGFNAIGGSDTGRYAVASGARLEFNGGTRTLTASGEITGTGTVVTGNGFQPARGTFRPGASAGVLTVEGGFPKLHPEGAVEVWLGGPIAGEGHSQLAVTGQARLGGVLRVLLAEGFAPAEGDRFRVLAAGSVHTFDNAFDALDLPEGLEGYAEVVEGGVDFVVGAPVSSEPGVGVPLAFAVEGPFPSPAQGATTLGVALPEAGPLRVEVFDLLGRRVALLAEGETPAGTHALPLDASGWPSGAYVVRVTSGGGTAVRRFAVAR